MSNTAVKAPLFPGLDRPASRLFFGTATAPVMTGEAGAEELLDQALACGVNAFDCARSYGLAEETLGRWMSSRGCRDQVVILTKGGDIRNGRVEVNRKVITEQLERSLETLRTERIDIYLLHRDDPNTSVEEFVDTLNEMKNRGYIRMFGASNWTHERIARANAYARAHGLEEFRVSSPNYGLAHQIRDLWGGGCVTLTGAENAEARAWYEQNQMPVIAYSSMGRGFFSGRFRAYDEEGAKEALDAYAQAGYLCEENMGRLKRAEELASRLGITVPEVALRYAFSSPMNVYAVVSSRSAQRLRKSLEAADAPLTAEQARYLESGEA